jgi:DtxR family Mn-dependent transcriptional regulator
MPNEHIEEYLEAIYDVAGSDGAAGTNAIAERLGVAPASVTEVFQRMAASGFVKYLSHKGASLTVKGLKIAIRLKRRHRLAEVFLTKILRIDHEKVHEQACKMEHSFSDEIADSLCRTLGGPHKCPHGTPIPPCNLNIESCQKCLSDKNTRVSNIGKRKKRIISITSLRPGKKGKVVFIRGGKSIVQRLSDLGLTPGATVCPVRSAPMKGPVEICVRGSNLIIGRDIAEHIFIQK